MWNLSILEIRTKPLFWNLPKKSSSSQEPTKKLYSSHYHKMIPCNDSRIFPERKKSWIGNQRSIVPKALKKCLNISNRFRKNSYGKRTGSFCHNIIHQLLFRIHSK